MPKRSRKAIVEMDDEQRRLVEENLALAKWAIGKYRHGSEMESDDRLQSAYEGLIQAAMTYDPARCCKFSTYATGCILNRLLIAAAQDTLIHLPINRSWQPSRKDPEGWQERIDRASRVLLLRRPVAAPSRSAEADEADVAESLDWLLSLLPERHRQVMEGRRRGLTSRAIASRLKISSRTVWKLQKEAIAFLREAASMAG